MKRKGLVILILILLPGFCYSQNYSAMTYNIRYDNPNDGENRWELRKSWLAQQIAFYEPDILGIQEGLEHQVDFLDSALTNYTYLGVGRDDGKTKGEYTAIFYKENKFELIQSKTFWLSDTPMKVSVGWDAALPRICTVAQLKNIAEGDVIWVFNTHFDHRGRIAREESVQLIISQIENLNPSMTGTVLMGDLNLTPDHEAIKMISGKMQDSASAGQLKFGPEGTFNGFNFGSAPTRRIDYIFCSEDIVIGKYAVLSDSKDLKYPSDHFPVIITFKLKK